MPVGWAWAELAKTEKDSLCPSGCLRWFVVHENPRSLPPHRLVFRGVSGMQCTGFSLCAGAVGQGSLRDHRGQGWSTKLIRQMIQKSQLPEQVKDKSIQVFRALAQAEAHTHGVADIDKVNELIV